MDKYIVAIGGLGIIGFIWWFFFGKKDEIISAGETIDILVDGGYKPSVIKIKNNKTTKLIFERRDKNSCLEEIVIPDFKIKEYLPLNKKVEIVLNPNKKGTYSTHCGMGMFHGKIIVE